MAANAEDFPGIAASTIITKTISSTSDLVYAKSAIQAAPAGNYILNITDTIAIGNTEANIIPAADTNISLRGGGTIHKSSGAGSPLFDLANSGSKLILRDATLKGHSGNNQSLVKVSTEFVMIGGEISGNNSESNSGAGVAVLGGTFTMGDGTIKDNNTTLGGGGLYIGLGGRFTMNGGEIVDNTAWDGSTTGTGGGIQIQDGTSVATIKNGLIARNAAKGTTDDGGGGIMIYGGSLTYEGGTIADNTTDSTSSSGSYNLRSTGGTFIDSTGLLPSGSGGFIY
ncbi:hypothetical protein AGMMS50229_06360 [Campylobacterota bacterium]|nr:hypothetical protein AGMMS50229_06360 [Campylobacterota bacterium]